MNTARWTACAFALSMMVLSGCVGEQLPAEPVNAQQEGVEAPRGGKADQIAQDDVIDEANCLFDAGDPYAPMARLTKGPFKGECLDTRSLRPVHVLSEQWEDEGQLVLSNFYHEGGFWKAVLPVAAIEAVYFQLEYFPAIVPAGHTQVRIQFSEPVKLEGHSSSNAGQQDEVMDIVLSVEAVPRVGDNYDLLKGAMDHFGLVYRAVSLETKYHHMVTTQAHHVEQWRLMMTEEEAQDFLWFYAYQSEALGLTETYHTLARNCTTEIIATIDGVISYTLGEQIKRFLVKVTEIYPNIVRTALIARGLLPLDQSTDWYPLEEDPSLHFLTE